MNIGRFKHRVVIRRLTDVPNAAFGTDQVPDAGVSRWACMEPVGGGMFWGTKQAGEDITHRCWLRYGPQTRPEDMTGDHVVDFNGSRYRVKRATNVMEAQRFTMLELQQLGAL